MRKLLMVLFAALGLLMAFGVGWKTRDLKADPPAEAWKWHELADKIDNNFTIDQLETPVLVCVEGRWYWMSDINFDGLPFITVQPVE